MKWGVIMKSHNTCLSYFQIPSWQHKFTWFCNKTEHNTYMYSMTTIHFCLVVHDNTTLLGFGMIYLLQADLETDEVFAQMTLQPVTEVGFFMSYFKIASKFLN